MTSSFMCLMILLLAVCASGYPEQNTCNGSRPVDVGKTEITDAHPSVVEGNVAIVPVTGAALLLTCSGIARIMYTLEAAGPLPFLVIPPSFQTTTVGDMDFA